MSARFAAIQFGLSFLLGCGIVYGQDDRDFSGVWKLNPARSEFGSMPGRPEPLLKVEQNSAALRAFPGAGEGGAPAFVYPLNGKETRSRAGDLRMSTLTKWEGAALQVNTLVSGPQNYAIMERWKRSRDGHTLTIRRTISRPTGECEAVLVYEDPAFVSQPAPEVARSVAAPPPRLPARARNDRRELAPKFSGRAIDGEKFNNDSLMGKVVLLQFWTTWCPTCRGDQDAVEAVVLDPDLTGKGLVVLAVNVGESKRKVQQYLARSPRSCKIALNDDTNLPAVFGVNAFPTYFVIDRDGRIAASQRGGGGENALRRMLSRAGLEGE